MALQTAERYCTAAFAPFPSPGIKANSKEAQIFSVNLDQLPKTTHNGPVPVPRSWPGRALHTHVDPNPVHYIADVHYIAFTWAGWFQDFKCGLFAILSVCKILNPKFFLSLLQNYTSLTGPVQALRSTSPRRELLELSKNQSLFLLKTVMGPHLISGWY